MTEDKLLKTLKEVRLELKKRYQIPKANCKMFLFDCLQCRAQMTITLLEDQIEILSIK